MKERWANYKSHNKKSLNTCSITKHFNEICPCPSKPTTYMSVQLIDFVDNCAHLSSEQINDILLNKEKFWVGMLVTMHKGMNSSHDWLRKNRIGGEDVSSAWFFAQYLFLCSTILFLCLCLFYCYIASCVPRLSICYHCHISTLYLLHYPNLISFSFPLIFAQNLEVPRVRDNYLFRMSLSVPFAGAIVLEFDVFVFYMEIL